MNYLIIFSGLLFFLGGCGSAVPINPNLVSGMNNTASSTNENFVINEDTSALKDKDRLIKKVDELEKYIRELEKSIETLKVDNERLTEVLKECQIKLHKDVAEEKEMLDIFEKELGDG